MSWEAVKRSGLVGLAASVPMLAVMRALQRRSRSVPPDEGAMGMAEITHVRRHIRRPEERAVTLVSHLGYGATAGAGFALARPWVPGPPVVSGICYAMGVWAASYCGWIPAVRILPMPWHDDRREQMAIIAGHIAWGAMLGAATAGEERRAAAHEKGPARRPARCESHPRGAVT